MTTRHKDFEITSVATDDIGDYLNVVQMEDILNDQLQLNDYGSNVKKIFFVFLAVPANNCIHENEVFFDSENHVLEGALKLDYNLLLKGSNTTAIKMMNQLFYSFFDIDTIQSITDFDYHRLQNDLKRILNE